MARIENHKNSTLTAKSQTVDLNDKEFRDDVSNTAFSLFQKIADRWDIELKDRYLLLGGVQKATYNNWKTNVSFDRDRLERISVLVGIHKGLNLLFADHDSAQRWLKSSNRDVPFGGLSPLQYIVQGGISQLYDLRRYIDAWRGGK